MSNKISEQGKVKLAEWLLGKQIEFDATKKQIIDFAIWYSGMEREKVERSYERYLKDKGPKNPPKVKNPDGSDHKQWG